MACCSNRDTLRNRIPDAEKFANKRCCHGARNSCNDNRYNRDGRNTANLLGYHRTHRNGDGLWNERKHQSLADVENLGARNHAGDARDATDENPRQNREPVVLECLDVPVQRNGEQDGYRSKKERNVIAAYFVCFVFDARDGQKSDDENGGDEDRVQKRVTPFVADGDTKFKSDDCKNDSKHNALKNQFLSLDFLLKS